MQELDYRKCENLRNGNYVKHKDFGIMKIKDLTSSEENAFNQDSVLDEKKLSRIPINDEILINLKFSKFNDQFKIKGYSLIDKQIFISKKDKLKKDKLLWTCFSQKKSNGHEHATYIQNSNWILITDFKIIEDGLDLERMNDYEKKGDIFLARYVHNLQNFIEDNPEYGDIDFSYFEDKIRK